MRRMATPDPVAPGQESVWDFPRPARWRHCRHLLEIMHGGMRLASTRAGIETLETSHPPTYYFPVESIAQGALRPNARRTLCEWKGQARYFDVLVGGMRLPAAAWCYDSPLPSFAALRGHVAFYAEALDGCFVGGEKASAQPGGFYGGWVTSHFAGPFKGVPGSDGW